MRWINRNELLRGLKIYDKNQKIFSEFLEAVTQKQMIRTKRLNCWVTVRNVYEGSNSNGTLSSRNDAGESELDSEDRGQVKAPWKRRFRTAFYGLDLYILRSSFLLTFLKKKKFFLHSVHSYNFPFVIYIYFSHCNVKLLNKHFKLMYIYISITHKDQKISILWLRIRRRSCIESCLRRKEHSIYWKFLIYGSVVHTASFFTAKLKWEVRIHMSDESFKQDACCIYFFETELFS